MVLRSLDLLYRKLRMIIVEKAAQACFGSAQWELEQAGLTNDKTALTRSIYWIMTVRQSTVFQCDQDAGTCPSI